jgi:hypothetical protein
LGNFRHDFAIPEKGFLGYVGMPTMVSYSEDPNQNDNFVVVFPCIHPGFVERSGHLRDVAARVFINAMQVMWKAYCEALSVSTSGYTKKETWEHNLHGLNYSTGIGTPFEKEFNASIAELRFAFKKSRSTVITQAEKDGRKARNEAVEASQPERLLLVRTWQSTGTECIVRCWALLTCRFAIGFMVYNGRRLSFWAGLMIDTSCWAIMVY